MIFSTNTQIHCSEKNTNLHFLRYLQNNA